MKHVFSAVDETVQIEIASSGHNEEAHLTDRFLTATIKKEIDWLAKLFKPNKIRLKLLASFVGFFNLINLGNVQCSGSAFSSVGSKLLRSFAQKSWSIKTID